MSDQAADTPVFFLGHRGLIGFLAFLNAFVPLSIDLYLPALPDMTVFFSTTKELSNLTLSLFMLFFAVSMLFWGPISDKYGRKPILYLGLGLFLGGCLLCGLAGSIGQLIFGRIVQATGSGAVQAVTTAIVKDCFKGRVMENVLVWIQTMTVLCPMLAPILGAMLLQAMSWRGLFLVLLGCGLAGSALALGLRETLRTPLAGPALGSLRRIPFVLRNRGFRLLVIMFSLGAMPFMAYLATSAFIYVDMFGTSRETYSYFFAANGCFALLGPLMYMRILREAPRFQFLVVCFSVTILSGVLLLTLGSKGPFLFALFYMPTTFFGSSSRPVGSVLMMSQLDSDNGTVASLMGCSALLCGSFSMLLASLWSNPVHALGSTSLVIGSVCLGFWIYLNKTGAFRQPE